MKFPSRVDSSVCGAVLSNRTSTKSVVAGFQNCVVGRRRLCRGSRDVRSGPPAKLVAAAAPTRGLSACSRSSIWLQSTFLPDFDRSQTVRPQQARRPHNAYSTAAASASGTRQFVHQAPPPASQDKEKLLSLVDGNYEGNAEEHFNFHRDPYRRGYAVPDGPKLQISERKDDVEYPSRGETFSINDNVHTLLVQVYTAIGQRLRHPSRYPLEPIYKMYRQLPEPRMLHLTWQWRNKLLKVMGTPRRRDTESMLRYFALMDDVKTAGLTLRRSQWNCALAFATKYAARPSVHEMESALKLWREMERDAKIMGNDVTFNVLFDVASKAGNFTLAEMIYKEMENRGIEFNRFHHVSLIHFFGLKLDSGGVRSAYREMVESGEMVDTVVLNCVISGLLRCGEETAAEETYERMKEGHSLASEMPQKDYMTNKVVTKVLMMFSRVGKEHPQLRQTLQQNIALSPDLHTFRLFVDHFALKVGNLQKIAKYLDEMKHLKVPIHPSIFLALFKGFYLHGGFAGSDWSGQRLEGVLSALYQAHDEQGRAFKMDRWVIIWALRAVKKCLTQNMLIETFDTLSQRWDVLPDRQEFMHDLFENILHGRDLKSMQGSSRDTRRGRQGKSLWP